MYVQNPKFEKRLNQQKVLVVSESGLFNRSDLNQVYACGANAVLVGESLMRQFDVVSAVRKLIGLEE